MGEIINGTAGNDSLSQFDGTNIYDVDRINGLGGNDTLSDYAGNVILDGGAGDDRLYAWQHYQTATLIGGAGNDQIFLDGRGAVQIGVGGAGADTITGRSDGQGLHLVSFEDLGFAVTANTVTKLYGESNYDGTEYYKFHADVSNDIYTNIDGYVGTAYDDRLFGGAAAETFYGGDGSNLIFGNQTFLKGAGDTIYGGDFSDETEYLLATFFDLAVNRLDPNIGLLFVTNATSFGNAVSTEGGTTIYGNAGREFIGGSDDGDYLDGGAGNDRIFGFAGDDTLIGGSGNDTLEGSFGADTIDGGDGDDLIGGHFITTPGTNLPVETGADTIVVSNGNDEVFFFQAGTDRLQFLTHFPTLTWADVTVTATTDGALVQFAGQSLLLRGQTTLAQSDTDLLTANPTNRAPVAVDDTASGPENQVITGDVSLNDTDADHDVLTYSVASGPSDGTVVLATDGTFTYTPNADYYGRDSFTYMASDGKGGRDTAISYVEVLFVNDPPVAVPDDVATDEDTPIIIDALANDTDPDGEPLLQIEASSNPSHGSATYFNGTITYTPDENFFGTDSFQYAVYDRKFAVDYGTVTVTVNPVNDAPVAVDDAVSTSEDSPITFAVLTNDTDIDGDTLTVSRIVSGPVDGSAILADNSIEYTPTADFSGTDSLVYEVTDGQGGLATATVDITVTAVNDAPVANPDAAATILNTAVLIDVLANDSDIEGDALTVDAVSTPLHGTVSEPEAGHLLYQPDTGYVGTETLTYTVTDGAASAQGTVEIAIANVPLGDNVETGSDGDDALTLGQGTDVVLAGGGNDSVEGGNGNDTIVGGSGNDTIFGDNGNDSLFGGIGEDEIHGGNGNDLLIGGPDSDTLMGDRGADTFRLDSFVGIDDILDFGDGGDVLDVGDLILPGSSGSIGDFVSLVVDGADTTVAVDADGATNGANFVDVAILSGTTDATLDNIIVGDAQIS